MSHRRHWPGVARLLRSAELLSCRLVSWILDPDHDRGGWLDASTPGACRRRAPSLVCRLAPGARTWPGPMLSHGCVRLGAEPA